MQNTPFYKNLRVTAVALLLLLSAAGCAKKTSEDADLTESEKQTIPANRADRSITQDQYGITLPLLDAFFSDSSFATDVKREVGLTDDEVVRLQRMAREETAKLQDINGDDYTHSTAAAQKLAEERITSVIGSDKGRKLAHYLNRRWSGSADGTMASTDSNAPSGRLNAIPTDTRIVVNAPAHRMDIFDNGKLVRTYTIAIGVPEFPLPVGMRQASEIVFNPTWTPPAESWIDSSKKFKAGQVVPAGSKDNPLGMAKIPIGSPSLIHGGKREAQLGTFASHGCVGLTDAQMRTFTHQLLIMAGDSLESSERAAIDKNKKESKHIRLAKPIAVELRYETVVVQDSALYIHRDVYDRGTNTEANVKEVLEQYGVKYDQLSDTERTQISAAIRAMSNLGDSTSLASAPTDSVKKSSSALKTGKGKAAKSKTPALSKKVRIIKLAGLAGKGYPSPLLGEDKKIIAEVKKR
jgi:lipoprotein-anchoring transpeptidase ErfK/SrfK